MKTTGTANQTLIHQPHLREGPRLGSAIFLAVSACLVAPQIGLRRASDQPTARI